MATQNTRYAREGKLSEWLAASKHIHFIGICGAGMRSLARICHEAGSRIVAMSFCEPRSCLGWLSS